ncbi:hypothetical protein M427DRAFT_134274 [Gonapodya prolifera JEL478]|uniref:Uncharacterized protein n=1 Tax=Gonapodya prolifera (strain JEL478) TaxID=1344416 RepID=A0A139AHQ5_GONPJ|nr:hypothetical protein M427DRAFT_134274 [Gonapodya prolifera JEL478]|eukprot:KXS16219.1 hypothetical protein M427DRAFT_134274 [Gonapodya prolifera JEL478]
MATNLARLNAELEGLLNANPNPSTAPTPPNPLNGWGESSDKAWENLMRGGGGGARGVPGRGQGYNSTGYRGQPHDDGRQGYGGGGGKGGRDDRGGGRDDRGGPYRDDRHGGGGLDDRRVTGGDGRGGTYRDDRGGGGRDDWSGSRDGRTGRRDVYSDRGGYPNDRAGRDDRSAYGQRDNFDRRPAPAPSPPRPEINPHRQPWEDPDFDAYGRAPVDPGPPPSARPYEDRQGGYDTRQGYPDPRSAWPYDNRTTQRDERGDGERRDMDWSPHAGRDGGYGGGGERDSGYDGGRRNSYDRTPPSNPVDQYAATRRDRDGYGSAHDRIPSSANQVDPYTSTRRDRTPPSNPVDSYSATRRDSYGSGSYPQAGDGRYPPPFGTPLDGSANSGVSKRSRDEFEYEYEYTGSGSHTYTSTSTSTSGRQRDAPTPAPVPAPAPDAPPKRKYKGGSRGWDL